MRHVVQEVLPARIGQVYGITADVDVFVGLPRVGLVPSLDWATTDCQRARKGRKAFLTCCGAWRKARLGSFRQMV